MGGDSRQAVSDNLWPETRHVPSDALPSVRTAIDLNTAHIGPSLRDNRVMHARRVHPRVLSPCIAEVMSATRRRVS